MNTQHRYLQIADTLREEIQEAQLGARLPSERSLCERFQVARGTVRQALRLLYAEGLIRAEKHGVYVNPSVERCPHCQRPLRSVGAE